MTKYEDGLWGGVGAIQGHGRPLSHADWLRFATTLQLEVKYPGINGIGVIHHVPAPQLATYLNDQRKTRPDFRIHPPHDEGEYWPITYIEPVAMNRPAVGLDMAHEANRFSAAKRARDSGRAQITGPIVLVQDSGKTPGFLFYAPFYEGGAQATLTARRARFRGVVYAPFVVKRLMRGVLAAEQRPVGVRLQDGGETIYDEHSVDHRDHDPAPLFQRTSEVDIYGRTWQFDIRSGRSFRAHHATVQPTLILSVGVVVDVALLLLFVALSRKNRALLEAAQRREQAQSALAEAHDRLAERTTELQLANDDLRHFVQAVSHDLRSPVRGIGALATWIAEDYAPLLPEDGVGNLSLLRARAGRLNRLLDSLVAHSRIGRTTAAIERIDVGTLLSSLVDTLEPPAGFEVRLAPDLPTLVTDRGALDLVFQNLIRNSLVHHDRDHGTIDIGWRRTGGMLEFTVRDDGPGVPDAYLERVLRPFERLKTRDESEGTGMGLALVKRQVEVAGGAVSLESGERGLTVVFTWPLEWVEERGAGSAAA